MATKSGYRLCKVCGSAHGRSKCPVADLNAHKSIPVRCCPTQNRQHGIGGSISLSRIHSTNGVPADRVIMLLSADWFGLYWSSIGVDVGEDVKTPLRLGCRD
jgi:hypothetical protein